MAAKKKPIINMSLADTGVGSSDVGSAAAWSNVKEALPRPPRGAGVKLTDEGNGGEKLVEFLVELTIKVVGIIISKHLVENSNNIT
jgi:electron transfer flavoprotein beta subunit